MISANSPETARYAAAWQDRRRRMIVFKTIQISSIPVWIGIFYLSSTHPSASSHLLLGMPIWFVAYMVTGVWLNRFRCPRCGKFYFWIWQWKGATERQKKWRDCHHCGLTQDAKPTQ